MRKIKSYKTVQFPTCKTSCWCFVNYIPVVRILINLFSNSYHVNFWTWLLHCHAHYFDDLWYLPPDENDPFFLKYWSHAHHMTNSAISSWCSLHIYTFKTKWKLWIQLTRRNLRIRPEVFYFILFHFLPLKEKSS